MYMSPAHCAHRHGGVVVCDIQCKEHCTLDAFVLQSTAVSEGYFDTGYDALIIGQKTLL